MNFISNIVKSFFSGKERSVVLKKNIVVSVLNKGVSFVVSFLLVSLIIGYVNVEQYGIWLTITSVTYWMSLFDFGLVHGLRNRLAESIAKDDMILCRKYVTTTYILLTIIFGMLLVVMLVANHYISWTSFLNLNSDLEETIKKVFEIVSICFCALMVIRIIGTIFTADQRPAINALMGTMESVFVLVVILILKQSTEGNLVYLAYANSVTKVIIVLIITIITFAFFKRYAKFRPSLKFLDFKLTRNILGLGGKFFIIQISMLVIYQLINFIITRYLGPENVTLYNVTYKYYGAVNTAFIVFLTPFWSACTDAYTKKDIAWINNSIKKLKQFFMLLVGVQVILFIISPWLIKVWLNTTIEIPTSTNILMAINLLVLSYSSLYMYFINGIGKITLQMIVYIIYAVISIPFMIFGVKWFGLNAIIILTTLINVFLIILGKMQVDRILSDRAYGLWNK